MRGVRWALYRDQLRLITGCQFWVGAKRGLSRVGYGCIIVVAQLNLYFHPCIESIGSLCIEPVGKSVFPIEEYSVPKEACLGRSCSPTDGAEYVPRERCAESVLRKPENLS